MMQRDDVGAWYLLVGDGFAQLGGHVVQLMSVPVNQLQRC